MRGTHCHACCPRGADNVCAQCNACLEAFYFAANGAQTKTLPMDAYATPSLDTKFISRLQVRRKATANVARREVLGRVQRRSHASTLRARAWRSRL